MSTLVTRSGKGSPLTHNEVDANFTNLNTDKVEKASAAITGGTINNTSIGATTPSTGSFTKELINQSYDQGTGVLQVTGNVTNNGVVTDKTLVLQGGNNLLARSQEFDNAYWTKDNVTVTASSTTAPDGTTTAQLVTASSSTFWRISKTGLTGITSTNIVQSIHVKQGNANVIGVNIDGNVSVTYTFSTNTFSSVGTSVVSTSSTSVGNGWFRLVVVLNTPSWTPSPIRLLTLNDNCFIWGAQLELGTVASAYTPTTTAAITTTNNISVPSGQVLASAGTASLPSYSFSSFPTLGLRAVNANAVLFGGNNSSMVLNASNSSITLSSNGFFGIASSTADAAGADTILARDSANTLAQRNSTNAQEFRVYQSYTDASNYTRGSIGFQGTALVIAQQKAGTGTYSPIFLQAGGLNQVAVGLDANAHGIKNRNDGAYMWAFDGNVNSTGDLYLYRDAANTLAQRNSTNAQTFRLYNTYTNASNYERLGVNWSSNVATIQTENLGTGVRRDLAIGQDLFVNGVRVGRGGGNVSTNTAVGFEAINATASGGSNIAVGYQAGKAITSGANNTIVGYQAMINTLSGSSNVAIGFNALNSTTAGLSNIAIGRSALFNNTNNANVAVGRETLFNSTTADNNVAVGQQSGYALVSGGSNVFLGYLAGNTGTNNLTTGSNNVLIGASAQASSTTVSNEITIGNSSNTVVRYPHAYSTVASLPSASTVGRGSRTFVTDASLPMFQATVAGGGAVFTPVYSDGTNWKVG